MYIEETGAGDGDIKVTIDGAEHTVEAVSDSNHDGIDDTAVVETDDGYLSFTDTNGDGTADVMRTLDEKGAVVSTSRFDSASGEWVTEGQRSSAGPQTAVGTGSGLIVHTADGEQHLQGELTDTDGDGKGDTLVVTDADGDTVVFADIDGDGDADVATEITGSGQVIVSEHRGNGEWVVVHDENLGQAMGSEPARLSDADWEIETATGSSGAQGNFHVDPVTGEWVDSTGNGTGIGGAQQPRWT
ncbi:MULTISPECIES: hypothetical protein [unclassified Crossiella]|uniref:hypothetical protein n=1 Tax=unclassified Crossiella TaxID=2620835 RepID=UPI0020001737|nr:MULTISPECIES: hypothetical protein [unclassified Crossiella]MCK2236325.1 hypothetical protein [Crossiella sp. S99.2]MCK2249992.1 hypothetical protein [Crossiella sp. S99.1]